MAEKVKVGTTMFGPSKPKVVYEANYKCSSEYDGGIPVYSFLVHDDGGPGTYNILDFDNLPESIKEGKKYLVRIYEYPD